MKASVDVLIATGGTGGHIFPALSCGDFFEKNGVKVLYLLAGSKIGELDRENVTYINSQHFEKKPVKFIKASYYLLVNFFRCLILLKKKKPCVIFATGSYAVAPVLAASICLRTPFYLLEQNVIPGIVNKYFARFAKGTFIAFEASKKYIKGNVILSGLPLRNEAKRKLTKEESRNLLGLPKEKVIVLVIGGSLGAKGMVEKIMPYVEEFHEFFFIIQTGQRNFDYFKNFVSKKKIENCLLYPFTKEIGLYYSAADIIISRAGASACMEIAFHEKPAILVPYPYSRDKHQYYNAKTLEDAGTAVIIDESNLELSLRSYLSDLSWAYKRKTVPKMFLHDPESIIFTEIRKNANCKKI